MLRELRVSSTDAEPTQPTQALRALVAGGMGGTDARSEATRKEKRQAERKHSHEEKCQHYYACARLRAFLCERPFASAGRPDAGNGGISASVAACGRYVGLGQPAIVASAGAGAWKRHQLPTICLLFADWQWFCLWHLRIVNPLEQLKPC